MARVRGHGVGTDGAPGDGGTPFTARRPDASMSLLTDLVNDSDDADYRLAARERRRSGRPQRPRPLLSAGVLLLTGLLLAAAGEQWAGQQGTVLAERAGLSERIRASTSATDARAREVAALEAEVATLRDRQLSRQGEGTAVEERLTTYGVLTGTVATRGPGLRVELSDAAGPVEPECEYGRVLDLDLQRLVNGLWAAGAEAVSVDGQRLTAVTAIRSANDAILVGYRPVTPPYEVLAVGDPRTLEARLAGGETGDWFATLVDLCGTGYSVAGRDEVVLPAAAGVEIRHAAPVTSARSTPAGAS
jgi:uncharacterized protein YlxW (UPF0749 family)